MQLQGIDHIALLCREPAASLEWYSRVAGLRAGVCRSLGGVPLFLQLGSTCLTLFPLRDNDRQETGSQRRMRIAATGPRMGHFALRAATQLDFVAAQEELRSLGIAFSFADHDVSHSIYFDDPDGHKVEITTYDVAAEK